MGGEMALRSGGTDFIEQLDELESPSEVELPPGLVGYIAEWCLRTSLYPNPALAIGAGLVTVGKLAARRVAGPLESTTVLYVAGIAETGTGKQRPLVVPKICLAAAGKDELIGPGSIASMQAVYNRVMTEPYNTLCTIDELGIELNRLINDTGNLNSSSIMRVFNELYTTGWDRFDGIDRAQTLATFAVAPAFGIWGMSTPREFYTLLAAGHVGNGFIGRLLVIPAEPKPPLQRDRLPADTIPEALKRKLGAMGLVGGLLPTNAGGQAVLKPLVRLEWGPGAEYEFDRLVAEMQVGATQQERDLQQRVPENALKIANTIASGRSVEYHRVNGWHGTIDLIDLEWGERIARRSHAAQMEGLDKYAPPITYQELCDAIHEFLQDAPDNWCATRELHRRYGRRAKYGPLMDKAFDELKREEMIEPYAQTRMGGGRPSPGYRLMKRD
jgi:hypothetical protein